MPKSLRIEQDRGYEVDVVIARLRGKFRLQRDSVFFDEQTQNGLIVAMAGVRRGDTIAVVIPGLAEFVDEEFARRPFRFVLVRTK